MIIIIKDYKKSKKIKNQFYFSAVPSGFFFFYWAVCICAIATSCELLFEVSNTSVPHVSVSEVTQYRVKALEKPAFTDKDVANLVNDVCFVRRWDHQSVQAAQLVLFFFALTGFSMLVITSMSYPQSISR